jgi:hypothetical protein
VKAFFLIKVEACVWVQQSDAFSTSAVAASHVVVTSTGTALVDIATIWADLPSSQLYAIGSI